jgi:hypothetical protein
MRHVAHVELDRFFEHGLARTRKRGDRFEQTPGAFVIVGGKHASAAKRISLFGSPTAIKAAAQNRHSFEDCDVAPRDAAVPDHEGRGGERADPAANHISLAISAFRLIRSKPGDTSFVCHTEMPTLS